MSATTHPATSYATTSSWASVHRAALLVAAVVLAAAVVLTITLLQSRESSSVPSPGPAADTAVSVDCGTPLEPVPC